MVNVAFFITGLDSGGIENYLLRFLQQNAHRFNKVTVFCKGGKLGHLEENYRAIQNVELVSKRIKFLNPLSYFGLFQFFRQNNIESACDFTGNFAGLVLLAAKFAGVRKRISFYRGSTNHFKETKFKLFYNDFVKRATYRYATDILSNSIAAFDFFFPGIWRSDDRFDIIYNGIPAEVFVNEKSSLRSELNIPANAFVVGHTGRYTSAKNHTAVIEVASKICETNDDAYFIMCGSNVADSLNEEIKIQKFKNRIFIFNNRSDIPKVLNTLDCFYFPSITEGQPNALLEAMIVGVPIVASDIPPIKESTPAYLHTKLVSPHDTNRAIVEIEKIKKKGIRRDIDTQQWAINMYNPSQLFDKFYGKLQ